LAHNTTFSIVVCYLTWQVAPSEPLPPIVENPFGVHDHDILCGRGAFVNGHVGNQRLRTLAQERKAAFDAGNYTEKRSLANEIVSILKALDPPGRFLKRASKKGTDADGGGTNNDDMAEDTPVKKEEEDDSPKDPSECEWEELGDEKAIHKACQVMRDIDRPDRKDREERRLKKKQKTLGILPTTTPADTGTDDVAKSTTEEDSGETKKDQEETPVPTENDVNKDGEEAVSEAVAATEAALDKALDAADSKIKEEISKAGEKSVEV